MRYYRRDGSEYQEGVLAWAAEFEEADRQVALDEVDGVRISTVWLGLDHSFGGPVPLIFETMVFGGIHNEWMGRYSTEDQARRGHARVVQAIREGRETVTVALDLSLPEMNRRLLDAADAIAVALEEERQANSAWVEAERDYLHAKAVGRAHAKGKLVADREDELYLMTEQEWVRAKSAAIRRETAKDALRACMAILSALQTATSAYREESRMTSWQEGRSA